MRQINSVVPVNISLAINFDPYRFKQFVDSHCNQYLNIAPELANLAHFIGSHT